jgi:RHS repeat-associated protein
VHNLSQRTNNALIQTFNVTSLNELDTITRNSTSALTVEGTTGTAATSVTINGMTAVRYNDHTFAAASFTPAAGANTYTAVAGDSLGRSSTQSITAYLPLSAAYTYDLNGNLLSDGNRCFAYDDENELISVWITNVWKSEFEYDGRLRKRVAKEFTWNNSHWLQTNETHYVYDGNMVIQERDGLNLLTKTYTRGNDLSGYLQGAGGIGGLLALSSTENQQTYYYHADGNGNVTALINSSQFLVAKYLYDPYGNVLSQTGPVAHLNPYSFSSKEYHQNSGLSYYLYRFYDPNLQRWLNRDPIQEAGGVNLDRYLKNNPIGYVDSNGQSPVAVAIGGGLIVLDAALMSQLSVDFQEFSYTDQQLANALVENHKAIKDLQKVINSDGEKTFQQAGLTVGGKLGTTLPGSDCQKLRNLFESLRNIRGYPTAVAELGSRLMNNGTSGSIPSAVGIQTADQREAFAKALLLRSQAYDQWLRKYFAIGSAK